MTKENHGLQTLVDRLGSWQRKLRALTGLVPVRRLPLLTPAEAFGPDIERFRDGAQALTAWRDKQAQWWTFRGHLTTSRGRPYAYCLSFFDRHLQNDFFGALPARWFTSRTFASHFSLSDPMNAEPGKSFRYWQRGGPLSARPGFAADDRFHIELSGWSAYRREDGTFALTANGSQGESLHLDLTPVKPLVYHGQSGFAQKDGGHTASFYCSYPRLNATGRLVIDGKLEDVKGLSWMDHEKLTSAAFLARAGWERLTLQLGGGEDLMIFSTPATTPGQPGFAFGSWISSDGEVKHLVTADIGFENIEYWISPKTGARYPIKRHLSVRAADNSLTLELDIKPALPAQEADTTRTTFSTQWEGAINATGTRDERPVDASGYLELLGRDTRPRAKVIEFLTK